MVKIILFFCVALFWQVYGMEEHTEDVLSMYELDSNSSTLYKVHPLTLFENISNDNSNAMQESDKACIEKITNPRSEKRKRQKDKKQYTYQCTEANNSGKSCNKKFSGNNFSNLVTSVTRHTAVNHSEKYNAEKINNHCEKNSTRFKTKQTVDCPVKGCKTTIKTSRKKSQNLTLLHLTKLLEKHMLGTDLHNKSMRNKIKEKLKKQKNNI